MVASLCGDTKFNLNVGFSDFPLLESQAAAATSTRRGCRHFFFLFQAHRPQLLHGEAGISFFISSAPGSVLRSWLPVEVG